MNSARTIKIVDLIKLKRLLKIFSICEKNLMTDVRAPRKKLNDMPRLD